MMSRTGEEGGFQTAQTCNQFLYSRIKTIYWLVAGGVGNLDEARPALKKLNHQELLGFT